MSDAFKSIYTLLPENFRPELQPKPKSLLEEIEEQACSICPSLSFSQRVSACFICIAVAFLLSLGSTGRIVQLLAGNPTPFAMMYTIGNILGICSTCFLFGPYNQMQRMFAPTRLIASGLFLFFMGLTLFLAFYKGEIVARGLWLVISVFCQFMALIWYTLSYIPFGREILLTCMKSVCGSCGCDVEDESFWA